MSNRLIKKFTKCKEGSLGYTLMEMLVVIGIIAIICAIAIPSVVSIVKSLRFAQRNDYAKSIFMAAQANLTEMRADGGLAPLQQAGLDSLPVQEEICGFPVEDWSPEYVYTSSEDSQKASYALVLPVGSVDGTLREQQVIIEYNPLTGNVYAVFYSEEKDQNILQDYRDGKLPRNGEGDEKLRKDMMLGYYDGSGLSSAELEIERTEARITFENGEEGIVTVHIPMPDLYVGSHEEFMKGLEVKLTVEPDRERNEGESELPKINVTVKQPGQVGTNCKLAVDGKTVEVTYVLDSLAKRMSFANLSAGTRLDPDTTQTQSTVNTSLTAIMDEGRFPIKPGENVTLDAEVTFQAANDRPNVAVQNAKLGGVNPMFGYLTENLTGGGYTLTIENGRNLQNLNAIAPSVADQITAVVFTQDIYWNQTVAYYNQNYGTAGAFKSPDDEAPARALPYFVPISNTSLFGVARLNCDEREVSGFINFTTSSKVPTLSDEEDTDAANHAKISGKLPDGSAVRIFNLNIDATKYTVPNNTLPSNPTDEQRIQQGHYYVTAVNLTHPVNYEFAGLFGYINTTIDSVHVVNPIVKGHHFVDMDKKVFVGIWIPFVGQVGRWETMTVYGSPATGALVGASGYNSLIVNCAAYIDTSAAASFDRSKLTQADYNKDADQNWYGVSGEGAVGGLVGYAKSHRTTTGALTGDTKYLAFSNCFAAVNVSGNMRGNESKHFGYSNGVGGLIGNSQLTNFYNCYASGNVRANGCYVRRTTLDWLAGGFIEAIQKLIGQEVVDLLYCGRRSMGAGGFVGTSHGTRYTNCFATGNVDGITAQDSPYTLGAGGFVGIMSYEETFAYGNDSGQNVQIAQRTVFENCYAVGLSRTKNQNGMQLAESFSGANARIKLDLKTSGTYVIGSYYRALAPCYDGDLWGQKAGSLPSYQNYYIFKDSYYLSQVPGMVQDNTNRCATAESYENLMSMHKKHQDTTWVNTQIDNIKGIKLYSSYEKVDESKYGRPIYGWVDYHYKEVYFDQHLGKGTPGEEGYEKSLEQIYREQYAAGFLRTELGGRWTNISAAATHPYSLARDGQAYPFSMINGLEYYGDWPYEPQYANIAYYEDYQDKNGNKNATGYYFNSEDTSTLQRNGTVLSDGYAIISANSDDTITISINGGKAETLTCIGQETYKPNGISAVEVYYVYRIPSSLYEGLSADSGYYVTAKVTVNGTTYTMYFNPTTAISHVIGATTKPETPDEIYIRTARQLNALSEARMQGVWASENTTIIQQLNIDAATYDWNGAAEGLGEIPTLSTIGVVKVKDAEGKETETIVPFNATYTGTGGYVAQAQIKGFTFAAPLFANVGDKGAVRSLAIEVVGGENGITIGKITDDYTALVAAVCSGDLENVDLTITGNVTLKAKTAAGLLAGYISGTEADRAAVIGCDIRADSLTVNAVNDSNAVNAPNAGAVIGQAEYCDIRQGVDSENLPDDVTLTIDGNLTLKGTDVGAYLGASGDLNGDKTIGEVNVDGLTLTLNGIEAQAVRAGALAGTLEKGDIKNLTVSLTGAYSAAGEDSVFAGVAAVAKNGLVQNVTITVNTNSTITADTAAGVFGSAENLTVQTTEVNVNSTITGTKAAAGLAASIEGGSFSGVNVKLMNATIIANGTEEVTTEGTTAEDGTVTPSTTAIVPTGRAAGFAVEIHGQVSAGLVIAETAGTITGNAEAAGFACEISDQVTGTRVAGTLNITANGKKVTTAEGGSTTEEAVGRAAGFAVKIAGTNLTINTNGVTPALENTAEGYKKAGSNNNLTVNGGNAAMFAVEIGKGVNVRNCYALGKLTGTNVSGFAVTNGGVIDGCSANVTISGGYAFVQENTGAVSNSYSWYGDGDANTVGTTATMEGSVVSSYFVDIDVPVTEDCKSADIYNSKKEHRTDSPLKLTAKELNGETGSRWFAAGTYGQYPYGKLVPAGYPYPMLRVHYGDWATPPRYAYGVMYYEKYSNGTWKLQIEDMSDPAVTVEDDKLTGYYTISGQNRTYSANNIFNNDDLGKIEDAGYAVFYKTSGTNANLPVKVSAGTMGDPEAQFVKFSAKADYTIRKLTPSDVNDDTITVTEILDYPVKDEQNKDSYDGKKIYVGAWYAHEFGTNITEHIIRTEGQLRNVAASGNYKQTHDIVLSENSSFATITGFAGAYNGNGRYIQKTGATNTWMNGVSGTVENLELVLGDLNTSFFGDVGGNVSLTQVSIDSLGANGRLVTNLNGSMTFTHVITADDPNPYHIRVGGQLSGVLIENVSGTLTCPVIEVGGDLAGKVIGTANAAVTNLSVKAQSISGAVIGTVSAEKNVDMSLTCAGEVSGSIVDTVNGSFTLNNNPNFGTVSGQLFDAVSGTVTLNKGVTVATMAQNGSLVGTMTTGGTVNANSIDVTTLGGSLVNTFTNGTMTTGAIKIGTLNAPLVAAFNGGTLQGAAESKKTINVDTVGTTKYLIGETVGGTVKNYNATLYGNAGLAETLSGTMQSMDLTVNVDTMTVDVVNTYSGTTLENLTVTVNGNMDGSLVENASKTVKNLQLTVTGDLTEDVMITAAAVEGLTVSVTGKMEGNGIGTATDAVTTMRLTVKGNLTGSGIATAESTVEALTITVGTGTANTMTGNAIGTAEGNVTTLNLTVNGTLKSSAIGTFSGTTLSGAVVKANAVAPAGTVNGILVNNNTGSITGSSVEAETITVTTSGSFGVIANSLASGKTMDATTVNVKELNLTLSGDSTIGGLIGENKGTIRGCSLNYTAQNSNAAATEMKVENSAAKTATVGGFVGVNSGTIQSGSDVKAKITYIQPIDVNTDKATIGGLVGKMSGGTLNGATVSGSIELTNQATLDYQAALEAAEAAGVEPAADLVQPAAATANGRSYIIGGAVGEDGDKTAQYTGVTTNVHVNDNWAIDGEMSYIMPAGRGAVGKFVGYVNNGVFTDCSATNANGTYMFLGEILLNTATLENDGDKNTNWYTSASSKNSTSGLNGGKDVQGVYDSYGYTREGETYTYYFYSAKLSNCGFLHTDGIEYFQTFDDTYIYQGTENQLEIYTASRFGTKSYAKAENLTVGEFGSGSYGVTNEETDYYYLAEDGIYYCVYRTYSRGGYYGNRTYTYTLKYLDSNEEYVTIYGPVTFDSTSTAYDGPELYTAVEATISSNNAMYMIVSSDGANALDANGNAVTFKTTFNSDENPDLYGAIWQTSGPKAQWQNFSNASRYLYLKYERRDIRVTDTSPRDITVSASSYDNGGYALFELAYVERGFFGSNTYHGLTYSSGSFSVSTSSSSEFQIYLVTTDGMIWRANFVLQDVIDQVIVARAADGTELDFSTSTETTNTDLPGETGEATQGVEVPEATGSNETATVPPAAEDGKNN